MASHGNELLVELQAENDRLRSEVTELRQENLALKDRLADLERRINKNPRNSSMPPSAEGLSKPPAPNRAARRAEARKQGKQPGSPGHHLAQVESPDEVVAHAPVSCASCGADITDAQVTGVETRQVFDLPRIAPYVTEHRLERRRCACGCEVKAVPPPEASAPACYGPGVRALACYLAVHQHLPYERMAELFADVLGIEISTGALAAMVTEAGGKLGVFLDTVKDLLVDAPAVHFDETGARVDGSLHWVHVASNAVVTLLDCHKRRGRVAIDEIGVMGMMKGIAVHDGWKPYRSYDVVHALCNAHHVRELEEIGAIDRQVWAREMTDLLFSARTAVEAARDAGKDHLDRATLRRITRNYAALVDKGKATNPSPASGKRYGIARAAHNLLVRLETYRADVLRFTTDFDAPFTNNQAERDVRLVKLQQKISGCWRTLDGARTYCAIRSYLSTMKKQDHDVLSGLGQLFAGEVWLPNGVGRT